MTNTIDVRGPGRAALAAAGVILAGSAPAWAGGAATERVSVATGGTQANGRSIQPSISADGRFIAFRSSATNLVPGDTNGADDVFVRDCKTGTTERVSVGPHAAQAEGGTYGSSDPSISADGRYVAFESSATNLVPGDTNGADDVFVRDRMMGTTERVSVGPRGRQADNSSYYVAISADGRFVAFSSWASNLVRDGVVGGFLFNVFVHDRLRSVTRRVSDGLYDAEPALSAGGGVVAFSARFRAGQPVLVEVGDRHSTVTKPVSGFDRESYAPALSAGGRFVAFYSVPLLGEEPPSFTPGVYMYDRRTGATSLASIGPGGVAADGFSSSPALSADGRLVAFASGAANLVPGDANGVTDVFVRDRRVGVTSRISVAPGGEADGDSGEPALSADGRVVAFRSSATNLVLGDTNGVEDVFVRTR